MQKFPQAGGASKNRRAVRRARLLATFKLATPRVEILSKRDVACAARPAANINRIAAVTSEPSQTGRS